MVVHVEGRAGMKVFAEFLPFSWGHIIKAGQVCILDDWAIFPTSYIQCTKKTNKTKHQTYIFQPSL